MTFTQHLACRMVIASVQAVTCNCGAEREHSEWIWNYSRPISCARDVLSMAPGILWVHVISDLMINGPANLLRDPRTSSITRSIITVWRQRKDLTFNWVFLAFCGVLFWLRHNASDRDRHVWKAYYPLAGAIKAVTALVSVATRGTGAPGPDADCLGRVPANLPPSTRTDFGGRTTEAAEAALWQANNELEDRRGAEDRELERINRELRRRITGWKRSSTLPRWRSMRPTRTVCLVTWSGRRGTDVRFRASDVLHRLPPFVPGRPGRLPKRMSEVLAGRTRSNQKGGGGRRTAPDRRGYLGLAAIRR